MKKSTEEKILTLHPQGKKGVNISLSKYIQIKDFILQCINERPLINFNELSDKAMEELPGKFDGKVMWYIVTVKLDLEARGIIERVPKTSPHQLRLKSI